MGVECIHLSPRGVVAGDVERIEIVKVGFDLRPLGHGETHIGENRGHFFGHLGNRVDRALTAVARGQGHIQPFGA